jgi:poly-gamma-glutamate synthesis protein (capsule biosynthesis protein)
VKRQGTQITKPMLPVVDLNAAPRVVLGLVGDVFLLGDLPRDGALEEVCVVLRQSDLGIANLENALSGAPAAGGEYPFGPALVGAASAAGGLAHAGIGLVSLANNHTANGGPDVLLETRSILDASGIGHAGAGRDLHEAFAPAMVDAGGARIGFVSAYSLFSGFSADEAATERRPGVAAIHVMPVTVPLPERVDSPRTLVPPYVIPGAQGSAHETFGIVTADLGRLEAAIRAARATADLVIVALHMHWGQHGRQQVVSGKVLLAHRAIDAGADVVVGHGPHILRGIEVYRGRPILYSLGDFFGRPESDALPPASGDPASDAHAAACSESLIARLSFAPGGWALELVPLCLDERCRPTLADDLQASRLLWRMAGLSAQFDTRLAVHGTRGYVTHGGAVPVAPATSAISRGVS